MGEKARLIQHWWSQKGGKTCGVFLFTDGVAFVPHEISERQEVLKAFTASPTASPQSILGTDAWWFPFTEVRRIRIDREAATFTVVAKSAKASGFLDSSGDMDYFLELLGDFCKSVTWKNRRLPPRFRDDTIRLVLAALLMVTIWLPVSVYLNVSDVAASRGTLAGFAAWVNAAKMGTGLAVAISAVPALLLVLLIVLRMLLARRHVVYEPSE